MKQLIVFTISLFCLTDQAVARSQPPTIAHLAAVAPDVIGIEIQAGTRIAAQQQSYDGSFFNWVDDSKDRHRWVRRGDAVLGSLVGPQKNILYPFDSMQGSRLDSRWADNPRSYRISSGEDANYKAGISPEVIYRKSRPNDMARTGFWKFDWPARHHLYLKLPHPLKPGKQYRIDFNNSQLKPRIYKHNSQRVRSEAVHVSQVGFRPEDNQKVAFLSLWRGNGNGQPYANRLPFEVINNQSGEVVFRGRTELSKFAFESEDAYNQNYTGTDVYIMNFAALKTTGDYRVCVQAIGCSYNFPVNPQVWGKAFTTSVRGLYHQRSGIKLGPPYTTFQRPRNMHPADGVKVYQSLTPLMDTQNGINAKGTAKDNFQDLKRGKTQKIVKDAWGGYADAGDWDRRIQHLHTSRLLLELAEFNPAFFQRLSLNIPESGNQLPDVLDEALWGLDFFRRLQTPEGGVRGGIESSDHPRHGEASWQESQTLLAYAPGLWSSYVYAGVAARAARVLKPYSPTQAETFKTSALKAMRWAETENRSSQYRQLPHAVKDDRNLAAAELYRLTGDPQWHQIFLQTTVFQQPDAPLQKWQQHNQTEAAFVYLNTQKSDPQVHRNTQYALLREADQSIRTGNQTAFKWTKRNPWGWVGWGNLTTPEASTLVRAHYLTRDQKYLDAILLATQYGAGANPLNMAFTTGIGQNFPKHPLVQDQRISAQQPPEGITVNGPLETKRQLDYWLAKEFKQVLFPSHEKWPTTEAYFDIYAFAPMNEFTVQSTIGPNAYIWGYLAAQ
ncbi:MAG: glycoside hydrolase family 9 protein [Pontibacterium sp.]